MENNNKFPAQVGQPTNKPVIIPKLDNKLVFLSLLWILLFLFVL
jgi:hypothetical protein